MIRIDKRLPGALCLSHPNEFLDGSKRCLALSRMRLGHKIVRSGRRARRFSQNGEAAGRTVTLSAM